MFGNLDKEHMSTTKLRSLCQGSRFVVMYASDFKQLACDISWDEVTFISQFQFGLRNNVKDLLFTMSNPSTLSQAIAQVV